MSSSSSSPGSVSDLSPSVWVPPPLNDYPHKVSDVRVLQYQNRSMFLRIQQLNQLIQQKNERLDELSESHSCQYWLNGLLLISLSGVCSMGGEWAEKEREKGNSLDLLDILFTSVYGDEKKEEIKSRLSGASAVCLSVLSSLMTASSPPVGSSVLTEMNVYKGECAVFKQKCKEMEQKLSDSNDLMSVLHKKISRLTLDCERAKIEIAEKTAIITNAQQNTPQTTNNDTITDNSSISPSMVPPDSSALQSAQSEITALQTTIEDKDTELTDVKAQLAVLNEEIRKRRDRFELMERELMDVKRSLNSAITGGNTITEATILSHPAYKQLLSQLDHMRAEFDNSSNRNAFLSSRCAQLESLNSHALNELTALKGEYSKTFEHIEKSFNEQIASMAARPPSPPPSAPSVSLSRVDELDTVLRQQMEYINQLNERLNDETTGRTVSEAQGTQGDTSRYVFALLGRAVRALKAANVPFVHSLDSGESACESAESYRVLNESLMAELDGLAVSYNESQTVNASLAHKVNKDQQIIAAIQEEKMKSLQTIALMKRDKEEINKRLNIAQQQIKELNESITVANEKSALSVASNEATRAALQSVEKQLMDSESSLHSSVASLNALKEEKDRLTRQVKETTERANDELKNFTGLKAQLLEAQAERDRLQKSLQAAKQKMKEKESSNKATASSASPSDVLNHELQLLKDRLRCPVCHMRDKSVVITKCFHLFCTDCIDLCIKGRHRKCPGCNVPFGEGDVKQVFGLDK